MELNAGFDSHDSVSNTTGQITSKQTNKKNNYCSFNDNENGEIAAH